VREGNQNALIHGHHVGGKESPELMAWHGMITRCTNPKSDSWKHYGGRGIKVCARWLRFQNFIADMGLKPSRLHSLDRVNNNGDYEPSNCRWATTQQQSRNKRTTRLLAHGGHVLPLCEWAERTGIESEAILARLRRGWTIARALTVPAEPDWRQIEKTHCKRGHAFSGSNLYLDPKGRKACRACIALAAKRYKLRKKAEGE